MNIVTLNSNNELVTTSLAIAEGVGNPHASVIKLIRNNLSDFEEFGRVEFEIQPFETAGGTQRREVAILNEPQAALLMTYFRNNGIVKEFKKRLVKEFYRMRDELHSRQQHVIPQTLPEALRLAAEQAEQVAILTLENKQQQEQIHSLESLFRQGMTIPQFCKMLNGVNVMKVTEHLAEARNWLYNESRSGLNKRWRVASYARDRYLTEEQQEIRSHGNEAFVKFTPVLLQAGAVRLYQLYLKQELPMKKNWDGLFTQDKVLKGAA